MQNNLFTTFASAPSTQDAVAITSACGLPEGRDENAYHCDHCDEYGAEAGDLELCTACADARLGAELLRISDTLCADDCAIVRYARHLTEGGERQGETVVCRCCGHVGTYAHGLGGECAECADNRVDTDLARISRTVPVADRRWLEYAIDVLRDRVF